MSETITISIEEYEELQEANGFLNALIAAGVDNWDGYGVAQDMLAEWEAE